MTTPENTKPGLSRGLRIVLIVSLAANLLVLGAVAGAVIGHGRHDGDNGRTGRYAPAFIRALEPDERRAIGREIRAARRTDPRDDAGGYGALLALLRNETLDRDAMRAELETRSGRDHTRQRRAQEIWLDHVMRMDAEARRAYADRIENLLGNKRDREKD